MATGIQRSLLFSQVGYEPDFPIRVIVRADDRGTIAADAVCRLDLDRRGGGGCGLEEDSHERPLEDWGEIWGTHWWVAEFPAGSVGEGSWRVSVVADDATVLAADGLLVGRGTLWDQALFPMAVEMLEPRAVMAKAKSGWMDAGAMWQESNAQSSMIIGLTDVLEFAGDRLGPDVRSRIEAQVMTGCDYLVLTQERAKAHGFPDGALSHDALDNEKVVLPNDASKAVVALRRAARLLPDSAISSRRRYAAAADLALRWLTTEAVPLGETGLSRIQRGLAADTPIPADEWTTRDLVMLCWAALETWRGGREVARDLACDTARSIMARQILEDDAESGLHGHFREYDSAPWSEVSWTHSISQGTFGTDAGGTFPNYVLPLIEMSRLWPNHADASAWRETLHRFTHGYLIPGCRRNPFLIVPQGVFGDEGALFFVGPWHGMNVIYGLTAALAFELADFLDEPALREIAYGNLQWVAGLNAGLTRQAIETGCTIFRDDVPEGVAVPVSMIHRVGNRTAGTWFGTRGVVCNGFATGVQFRFDVEVSAANDGPHSFTDEDWIPHSAGWLSGLARLVNQPGAGPATEVHS